MAGESIGLICDGNRRDEKMMVGAAELTDDQLYDAYDRGGRRIREVMIEARDATVGTLALWGMSDKNMEQRSPREKRVLYRVFEEFVVELRDAWVDKEENRYIRFVHMGRRDRLDHEAPRVTAVIDQIAQHTCNRSGMVVAIALDYGGIEEQLRAIRHAAQQGENLAHNPTAFRTYLDLPRQGVPWKPFDLVIRTGLEDPNEEEYDNEFLLSYLHETRRRSHRLFLPQYTADQFAKDLRSFRMRKDRQRRGK